MKSIIVVAYQLNPYSGSECAVAWDYIKHMSKRHRLTVLYGSSGEHHEIGNTAEMEAFTEAHPIENVAFIPVKPSFNSKWWDYSLKGIREFYKEYRLWHDDAYNIVMNLIKNEDYSLIHFLGPIGYHEPGKLYTLPIPYIWGPIGGMAVTPARVMIESSAKYGLLGGGLKLIIKSIASISRLFLNERVKRALKSSDVVICATTGYVRFVEKAISKHHHSQICYLPENCIDNLYNLNYSKFNSSRINLIFIGRLDEGKAPFLILEALTKVRRNVERFHLDILGKGPLLDKACKYVEENGLANVVKFHGNVKRELVADFLDNAQLMLLPTLYDANTTVIWEAMSHSVPTLCLDHCGMHDTVQDDIGFKIPVTSYRKIVNAIADQLQEILDNPGCLRELADNLLVKRNIYSWDRRSEMFESFYSMAEKQYNLRKK